MTISQSEKARLPRLGRVFIIAHKTEIFEAVMRGETLRSIYDNWSPTVPISYSRFAGLVRRWCGDPVGELRATAVTRPKTVKDNPRAKLPAAQPEAPSKPLFTRPENPRVREFNPDEINLDRWRKKED